jgi:hypothetical protein
MNNKPFEWIATMSNAYGWKGCWIDMLHAFIFKIIGQDLNIPM